MRAIPARLFTTSNIIIGNWIVNVRCARAKISHTKIGALASGSLAAKRKKKPSVNTHTHAIVYHVVGVAGGVIKGTTARLASRTKSTDTITHLDAAAAERAEQPKRSMHATIATTTTIAKIGRQ